MRASLGPAIPILLLLACQAATPRAKPNTESAPQSGSVVAAPTWTPQSLKVAYSSLAGTQSIPWIAKDYGIFDKYALEVELVYIAGSTEFTQALLAGDVAMGLAGGTAIINAVIEGAELAMVGAGLPTLFGSIVGVPEVRTSQDLKGKRVGITGIGTVSDRSVRWGLRKVGLDPDRDVTLVSVRGIPEILAALSSGAIDAGYSSSGALLRARQMGFNEVVDLTALDVPFLTAALATSRAYLRSNGEVVDRLLRAYVEATQYYKTHPQQSMASVRKYANIEDQEALDYAYQMGLKYFQDTPYVPLEAVRNMLSDLAEVNPKATGATAEAFVDNSLLARLEQSGFVRDMARRYGR